MGHRPVVRRSLASAMGSDVNAIGDGLALSTGRGIREKPRAAKATWKVGDTVRGQISESVVAAEGVEFTSEIPGGTNGVWLVVAQVENAVSGHDVVAVTGRFPNDTRAAEPVFGPVTFLGPGSPASPVTVHVNVGTEEDPFTGDVVVNISALRMGS